MKRSEVIRQRALVIAKRRIPQIETDYAVSFSEKEKLALRYLVSLAYGDGVIDTDGEWEASGDPRKARGGE